MCLLSKLRNVIVANFLLFFLLLYSSGSNAENVDVTWEIKGKDLHYVITSVYYDVSSGISGFDCGILVNRCYIQMGLSSVPWKDIVWKDYVSLRGKKNSHDIVNSWKLNYMPKSGVISNWLSLIASDPKKCITIYIGSDGGTGGFLGSTCDGTITPPIIEPPPPPLSCSIVGSIILAHGVLDSHSINGHTKSVNVLVSCTRAATARITTQADLVALRADGSLKSQLKVNGINGSTGTTVSVPGSSGTNVQFSSTLISNGDVAAGAFSGSAVALVTII